MTEQTKKLAEACIERAIAEHEVAGASLLVIKDGKEELYVERGKAECETGRDYGRDTIVRLYSATKPITSVAAMILMERGLLDAGAWLCDYLPEYADMTCVDGANVIPCGRNILIKEVLNMTSGLAYGGDNSNAGSVAAGKVFEELDRQLYTENKITTREVARKLSDCPLAFEPGSRWMYGTSADIMGAVVEAVTGMKFGEFLQKEIFEPLGMHDTAFYVPKEKQHRLAKVYERVETGMKECSMKECSIRECRTNNLAIRYTQDVPPAFESGGAGLVSTIDDYAKFAQMLLQKGSYKGKQILSERTVEYMTQAALMPWQQESMNRAWESLNGYTYGNFLRILKEPEKANMFGTKGEYGWDGWLGFYFINSPKDNLTMLLSCQRKDAGTMPLTRKLKNIVWSEFC